MERGPSAGQSGKASVEQRRVTVQEATRQLDISEHAVRQRIRRGTLDAERDEEGRVYVYLSAPSADLSGEQSAKASGGQSADGTVTQPGYAELLEEKDTRIADLQQQLEAEREARRRADHIIAALTERIPELEAPPQSAREAESVAEESSEDIGRERVHGGLHGNRERILAACEAASVVAQDLWRVVGRPATRGIARTWRRGTWETSSQ